MRRGQLAERLGALVAAQRVDEHDRDADPEHEELDQAHGRARQRVVWLASGARGPFWPAFVLLIVLIPLVRNGWRLYGPAPELDRVERELMRGSRHHRHRHHRGDRRL